MSVRRTGCGAADRRRTSRGKACGSKRRFPGRDEAARAADLLNTREPWAHPRAPYRCPYCAGHHIGRPRPATGRSANPRRR
ncbi:hypothetical protein [Kitasatospora sp. NPDC086791]|uniref:hypothetical protein n=1 Tax=Kitasatospora sp. NPDC086791 TaxID=3155178 RepID=UPI0034148710